MNHRGLRSLLLLSDLCFLTSVLFLCNHFPIGRLAATSGDRPLTSAFGTMLVVASTWSLLFAGLRLDQFESRQGIIGNAVRLLAAACLVTSALAAGGYIGPQTGFVRFLAAFAAISFLGTTAIRVLWRSLLRHHRIGPPLRKVAVLGDGKTAGVLAHSILHHPELRFELIGSFLPNVDGHESVREISTIEVLELIEEKQATDVVIAFDSPINQEVRKLIVKLRAMGITVSVVPSGYELYISKPRYAELDGVPLLALSEHVSHPALLSAKLAFDVVGASLLLVFCAPFLAACALFLLFTRGQAFLTERRCGRGGTEFEMYRLAVPRGVRPQNGLESMLLRLSLTELPQLVNVIKGDMSLIGPRPESSTRVRHYSEWHRRRLNVRPGITGLAQAHGVRDEGSSDEKSRFDLQYIVNWSPFLDATILAQTVLVLLRRLRTAPADVRGIRIPFAKITSFNLNTSMRVDADADRQKSSAD